ncbi:hypothetical protein SUGI_1092070 [Cryptomeria japonica]|nr:hypothetical protein SUGI_1092070 [Cryptomeria japonica]
MIITLNDCTSSGLGGGDTLQQGASLAGNQTIISKNGTFALGFFSPRGTNNWYVGIWYAGISPKVIAWVANRDNPVRGVRGVLNFSSDGRLRLFDRKSRSVWSTDFGLKGWQAVIKDSGNFIVTGHNHNTSEIVWESFDHPGDTWLPGMKMWKGMKLTSWKSSVDPASGLFSVGIDTTPGKTQLVLAYNNSVPYWSSGEWTGVYFSNNPEGHDPMRFVLFYAKISPSRMYMNFTLFPSFHTVTGRFQLDENGEIHLYCLMDDGTWIQGWSTYQGQCSRYDICGAYGLCNLNDACSCIEGFTPKHKTRGLLSSGCARRGHLQCSVTGGSTDGFLETKNRSLPEEQAVSYNEPTLLGCRTACLNNCSCTAFAFVISDLPACRLWFGDLLKMRVSPDSQSIFIRLVASELPQSTSMRSSKAPVFLILVPSTVAFTVVLVLLLAAFFLWKRRRLPKERVEEDLQSMLRTFTYKELRIATKNFKHKIGSGAFASVFKGTLPDSTFVAVKILEGRAGAEKQFRAEINTIGIIQHVNLVRLCGFCVERSRRLLVYAYMPNGSLNSLLFRNEEKIEVVLDWKSRMKIALGTARGLVYLHEECMDQIIHCDLKPENILLDSDFSPKIADFGLAKLVGRDFSRVLTTTRGTRGYLAPEWISGLPITPKVDVYSFGMTLLEIISGRRNLDLKVEESRLYFPTWASSQIGRGNIIGVVDVRIASEANIEEVKRAAVVGGLCIQEDENLRPSMSEVVKILEGKMEAPSPQIPRSPQVLLVHVDNSNSDTSSNLSSLKSITIV